MTFRIDDRARVPFALIGVVILLTSTAYTVSIGAPPPRNQPETTAAIRETTGAVRSALHSAVRSAGARAATNPVITPANTSYGRVIDKDIPYHSSFRLRIAVAIRRALNAVGDDHGPVTTDVSVATIDSPATLRAAMRNISIDPLNRSTPEIAVTVEGITIEALRGGHVVATTTTNLTVRVATPVFVLHDRVETFQHRLQASPWEPGLARQTTARLYAIAWARGYAQYGGIPIENVVANRHLSVATNGALLAVQRSVFGTDDPMATRAHARALATTGARDLLTAADIRLGRWAEVVRTGQAIDVPDSGPIADPRRPPITVPTEALTDAAFTAFVDASGNRSLHGAVDSAFTSVASLATDRTLINRSRDPAPTLEDWSLEDTTERTTTTVTSVDRPPLPTPAREETVASYDRRVEVRTETVKTWRRGDDTRTTTGVTTETWTVRIAVRAHLPYLDRLDHPVDPQARQTAIDSVTDRIIDRLITDRGGPATVAERLTRGTLANDTIHVPLPVPDHTIDHVYRSTAALRSRIANQTISVPSTAVPTGGVTERVSKTLANLSIAGPADGTAYTNLTARAAALAKHRFLDRVQNRVADRGRDRQSVLSSFASLLTDHGIDLRHITQMNRFLDGIQPPTPAGPSNLTVAAVPAYLTRTKVDNTSVPGLDAPYYPLATRNRNLVTVPYGEAAAAVTAPVRTDDATVTLDTAGRALRIANQTLHHHRNASLATRRDALQRRLDAALADITASLVDTLHRRSPLPRDGARTVVHTSLSRWSTVHDRVRAATNGSLAATVIATATDRADLDTNTADRLGVDLRETLRSVNADTHLQPGPLTRVTEAVRDVADRTLEQTVADTLDRSHETVTDAWTGDAVTAARGGVPILPIPGYWVATANAWRVQINGSYARFAVASPIGAPIDDPGGTVEYIRQRDAIRIDVDQDGTAELIGHNRRLRFSVDTAVVIVVPPGGGGVADTDGVRDERSPGWNRTTTH